MKLDTLILIAGCSCAATLAGAQSFRNLGFESPRIPPLQPGSVDFNVPISVALPNWKGFVGTNALTTVVHNTLTVSSASISLYDRLVFDGPHWVIDGDYTVILHPGSFGGRHVNTSISQFGMVPAGSESLQLKSLDPEISVTFAGQQLPLFNLGAGVNYTLLGADISAFVGQSGELTISASRIPTPIDSIVFSPQQVPEPRVAVLLGVGLLVLTYSLMRHRPPRASSGKTSNAPTPPALKFPDGFE